MTDTWVLYSESVGDNVYITNVSIQLRRPTLGVWNISSNEFYFGARRIEAYVSGSIQLGTDAPADMEYLLTNVDEVFGGIGMDGTIEILDFVADGGDIMIQADLDYDIIAEMLPPNADVPP